MSDSDDLGLVPPDCPSREEQARRWAPVPKIEEPPPPPSEWPRFSISDLLIVTVGVAIGLAGGTWMPADLFAAILGLITLLGLLLVHLFPLETRVGKLIWAALVLGYITAVFAALLKSAL